MKEKIARKNLQILLILLILTLFSFLNAKDFLVECLNSQHNSEGKVLFNLKNNNQISEIVPPQSWCLAEKGDGPIFPSDFQNPAETWKVLKNIITFDGSKYTNIPLLSAELQIKISPKEDFYLLDFEKEARINGNSAKISYKNNIITVDFIELNDYKLYIDFEKHPKWQNIFTSAKLKDEAGNESDLSENSYFLMKNQGYRYDKYTLVSDFFEKDIAQYNDILLIGEIEVDLSYPEVNQEISVDILAKSKNSESEIILADDFGRTAKLSIPDLNYYNLEAKVLNKREQVTSRKDVRSLYVWTNTNSSGELTYSYNGQVKAAEIKNKNVFLPYDHINIQNLTYSDKNTGKREKVVIKGKQLEVVPQTNIVIIDLNSTGEGTNEKNNRDFINFINDLIDLSKKTNILLYQYMSIFPNSENFFQRYDVNEIKIFEGTEVYSSLDKKYHRVNSNNYLDVNNLLNEGEVKIESEKKLETFYVLEPFNKLPKVIQRTDCIELINRGDYEKMVIDIYSQDLSKSGFNIDNIYFITYYPKEKNIENKVTEKTSIKYLNYLLQKNEIIQAINNL